MIMIPWRICVSILAQGTEDAIRKIKETENIADIVEIRLDSMKEFDLKRILEKRNVPILVTYRRAEEGGLKKNVRDEERIEVLKEAILLGADYVDVEYEIKDELRNEILKKKEKTKIVLSKHFFNPVKKDLLYEYAERLVSLEADILKLIGYADSWEDNLLFLNLVEKYSKIGYKLISFAMGPYGRVSRIMCTAFGSPWTYASLKEKAAPGQISAHVLKKIWSWIVSED